MHTAMGVLGGKWKFVILYSLMDGEARRFKVLERSIAGITARMLIKELKSLESEGLVQRTAYPTVPPTVQYRLTYSPLTRQYRLTTGLLGQGSGQRAFSWGSSARRGAPSWGSRMDIKASRRYSRASRE